jgi:small subunit ribosomal protein S20
LPHSRSAAKSLRKSQKLNAYNKAIKTHLKTRLKKFNAAIAAGSADEAKKQALMLQRTYDRAVTNGVVHKNNASRHVAQAQSKLRKLAAAPAK